MGDFFYSAYFFISHNKRKALALLTALLIALAVLASRIRFDDDIASLIPQDSKTQKIQEVLRAIAFTDKIVVNINKTPETPEDSLIRYANEFLDSLNLGSGQYIKGVQGKVAENDFPKTFELVQNHLPIFLDQADYALIAQKLHPDSILHITHKNYRALTSPAGIVTKKNMVKDPLGLTFMALNKLQKLGLGEEIHIKNGFLLDKKGQNILLFITPAFGSGATDKNAPFVENLYRLQGHLDNKYGKKVQIEYYGAALVAVANAKQIKKDVQFTASIALGVLLLILVLFYRKIALPIILFIPTVFGGLLAVAVLVAVRDQISAISLGIGSVLLGVTLDYSLHILTHIRNGSPLKSLSTEVAPSVLMSSLTTASAFLCLLFLNSQALQDLGIFAAISVLGASVFALVFIPQVYRYRPGQLAKATPIDRLAGLNFHKDKYAIGVLVVLLLVCTFTYKKVVFNNDIASLNYEPEHLVQARENLESVTDMGSKSLYLATFGTDPQVVLQKNDQVLHRLGQLKDQGQIVGYSSLGTLLPSQKKQLEEIAVWTNFWDAEKVAQIKDNLIKSGNTLGFKENTFEPFYAILNANFKPMALADIQQVPSFPVDDFMVSRPKTTTVTTLVKVEGTQAQNVFNTFKGEPNTLVIDRKQVNETLLGNLKTDFNKLLWYSLAAVFAILLVFYRSFTLTLITGLPLVLSWFLTIGLMAVFKIEFNIFNIIISSFIFGLGVDYGIFVTSGLLTKYRTGENVLGTHKTSIILSVITTLLGIGVLVFAKHPALRSVAAVSIIGIFAAAFVAFTLQPMLFRLFMGSTNKRPITPRYLVHSLLSFGYFDLGGLLLSAYSWVALKIDNKGRSKAQYLLHRVTSKFMRSVLYTNPFLKKEVLNPYNETFQKPAMLIANHASFLDILAVGMLHPKLIYLVKDHVYNSPIVGSAAKLHGAYPVSQGLETGEDYLRQKIAQGFSIIAFPEGTRSKTNKIERFHKGAFFLAEKLGLDILPILVQGTAEVSPKNSFIIRDGSITIKILPRVKTNDMAFGATYAQRPKQIGSYFRAQMRLLRNAVEHKTYWHQLILENYRHKGTAQYAMVKADLNTNANSYWQIMRSVPEKANIVLVLNHIGVLPLLLALDAIDRKMAVFIADAHSRAILKHNYLTHQYSKITVCESLGEALGQAASILIIHAEMLSKIHFGNSSMDEITTLIVLEDGSGTAGTKIKALGFGTLVHLEKAVLAKRS